MSIGLSTQKNKYLNNVAKQPRVKFSFCNVPNNFYLGLVMSISKRELDNKIRLNWINFEFQNQIKISSV